MHWHIKLLAGLIFLTVACSVLAVGDVPLNQALTQLLNEPQNWNAIRDERLPRLIVMLLTGASLAVAGAVMQSLFQNALASPSILAITPGGSFAVMLVMISGLHLSWPIAWPLAAVFGCLTSLLIVYGLAKRSGSIQMHQLLLIGIALSTLLMTIQGVILFILRDEWQLILTITEWEAGSTYNRTWQHVNMQLPLALIGLTGCLYYRETLDLFALGEEEALNLGVDITQVRWRLFLFVSLLVGGAIAAIGMVAFFGLIIPHVIRTLSGPSNKRLIPLTLFAGATALPLLDILLRLTDFHSISIGNISALIGGLFFLTLLMGSKSRWRVC